MFKFDSTVDLAMLVMLITLVTNLLSVIINVWCNYRMRKLELSHEDEIYKLNHIVKVLETALEGIGEFSTGKHCDKEFAKVVFPALPFMSEETKNKVLELYNSIFEATNTVTSSLTIEVTQLVDKDLRKYLK